MRTNVLQPRLSRRQEETDRGHRLNLTDEARLRTARQAFRFFHAQCFWHLRADLEITLADIPAGNCRRSEAERWSFRISAGSETMPLSSPQIELLRLIAPWVYRQLRSFRAGKGCISWLKRVADDAPGRAGLTSSSTCTSRSSASTCWFWPAYCCNCGLGSICEVWPGTRSSKSRIRFQRT